MLFKVLPLLALHFSAAQQLAIGIQTFDPNHHIIHAGRETWRRDVLSVIVTNTTETEHKLNTSFKNEFWVAAPNGDFGWNNDSEERYTGVIRITNETLPKGSWDFLLNADDDTIWLLDNVKALVRDLDPDETWFISDALGPDAFGCTFPEEASELGPDGCVHNPPAVPCFRSVMEGSNVCNHEKERSREGQAPSAGVINWSFGNSGQVFSRGWMNSISEADFSACEHCNTTRFDCYGGGDVRIGECSWSFAANGRGIAPTLPYSRTGVRVFGHGFGEIMQHAEAVVAGKHCDDACRFVLDRVLSTDLHHAPEQVWKDETRRFARVYNAAKRILHRV